MKNLPAIKIFVDKNYITDFSENGLVEAYLLAADCRKNSIIKFTVYLSSGAIWSGLPINAVWTDRYNPIDLDKKIEDSKTLQPFSCLENPISIITYDLVKNTLLECELGEANYLFTINYEGDGLAEDPEQYKTHNIVVLKSGQLAALPNNHLRFKDNWFSDLKEDTSNYKRNKRHWFPGG